MSTDVRIGDMPVYQSIPEGNEKLPGLIVIHEIWGLVDHIKHVADRFAKEGYHVLAPDLFYDTPIARATSVELVAEMNDPATRDQAQLKMRNLLDPVRSAPGFSDAMVQRLSACVTYLQSLDECSGKVGVVGFCFGGTYAMQLAAHEPQLTAAVSFYGQPLAEEALAGVACPILSLYGEQDAALMESLPLFREAIQVQGKNIETCVYEKAAHAFFNDTNEKRYNSVVAQDAWQKTVAFFSHHLK